jgi:hypothetical protein
MPRVASSARITVPGGAPKAARKHMLRYLRRMWRVGCNEPNNQFDAAFESAAGLEEALDRLLDLKRKNATANVWGRGPFYDVSARWTEAGEIGFVVYPSVEADYALPATCCPYSAKELLELAAVDAEITAAEDECPTCNQRRRGRYANRSLSGSPLFLCSTCERWTETVPRAAKPGRRSRRSGMAG